PRLTGRVLGRRSRSPGGATMDVRRMRIRFAIVFGAVAGLLLTLYSFPYAEHGFREIWFARYLAVYAHLAGWLLHLTDSSVRIVNSDLVGRVSLTVAKNCDAMDVTILFASAIVAFPVRWRERAVGIVAGVALLAIANLVRIVSLYYVGVHWPAAFEAVHAEVWPLGMVALAVAAFVVWSRWAADAPAAREADEPAPA